MTISAAFDALATDYDAQFTGSAIGRVLRRTVWRRLDAAFAPGSRVLELNCGTGEDALHLASRGVRVLATDSSGAMIQQARAKLSAAGVGASVEIRQLAIEDLAALEGSFDGVFSNFGGLNCVENVAALCRPLAALLPPGAPVFFCVMGPVTPWEWFWFLIRGEPRKAFRRLAREGTRWRGLTVRYPSIRAMARAFAPEFRVRRVAGLGVLLPPSYAAAWLERRPALLARLDRWERRIEAWPGVAWLGDHYIVEMERR
jgi:2-polyprenyl-3-methyl-5-hydroxy-6-metoxy-1,4-benzoquinol methylase